jgi:HAD superfamily hydrolase (TIGR01662 family)
MSSKRHGVIFDLDQTLVNSDCVAKYRDARNWTEVRKKLDDISVYGGINELLLEIRKNNILIGIVTSTPSWYCNAIISKNHWTFDISPVCYHDTSRRKPFPDPILEALKRFQIESKNALSIGDDGKDITASKNAGVYSVGSAWGCNNIDKLREYSPDTICQSVDELREVIFRKFSI